MGETGWRMMIRQEISRWLYQEGRWLVALLRLHVAAGQWIFSRLDDVPITALSQYDRPWSFMNEARVTTRGYRASRRSSPIHAFKKTYQSRSRAWSWFRVSDLSRADPFHYFISLRSCVYKRVKLEILLLLRNRSKLRVTSKVKFQFRSNSICRIDDVIIWDFIKGSFMATLNQI